MYDVINKASVNITESSAIISLGDESDWVAPAYLMRSKA